MDLGDIEIGELDVLLNGGLLEELVDGVLAEPEASGADVDGRALQLALFDLLRALGLSDARFKVRDQVRQILLHHHWQAVLDGARVVIYWVSAQVLKQHIDVAIFLMLSLQVNGAHAVDVLNEGYVYLDLPPVVGVVVSPLQQLL